MFMMVPLQSIKILARCGRRVPRAKLEFIARMPTLLFAISLCARMGYGVFQMSFMDVVREIIQQGNIFHFLASNVR
ncbi:hypothetical protein IGS59_13005 [Janthinobacterium sp. GW460P]|uniref:hypothetical protein n=1 Tax=unclassified Janthinobacterium TaxID=2610881 RepID=UPI00111BFF6B|nr:MULTISPECIES: hypothetical protein [unclassified Janthinobacterium]MCC7703168.1 hypothetical protein [Janthinobacterium sp. GW460P]MCC7708675.1 hypothetical protein [Janthinobacterium sp. GW460W]